MKVFISWSGERSQAVASLLKDMLSSIVQTLDCFMSLHDIEPGERWGTRLAKELDGTSFGLLCLTRENLNSPWLIFEAGALAKQLESRVCAILVGDLKATDVRAPLSQFQHCKFEKDQILRLLLTLRDKSESTLSDPQVSSLFEKCWGEMESAYRKIPAKEATAESNASERDVRDIVEEILLLVRQLQMPESNFDIHDAIISRNLVEGRLYPDAPSEVQGRGVMLLQELGEKLGLKLRLASRSIGYSQLDFMVEKGEVEPWKYERLRKAAEYMNRRIRLLKIDEDGEFHQAVPPFDEAFYPPKDSSDEKQ